MDLTAMQPAMQFRYVHEDVDRHGRPRTYFWRRPGRKVRLRAKHGTPEFVAEYFAALADSDAGLLSGVKPAASGAQRVGAKPGTLGAMWLAYASSQAFKGLDPETRAVRTAMAEAMFAEPVHAGAVEIYRDFPLDRLTTRALEVLRDRKGAALPNAANNRVKVLQALFKWAVHNARALITTDLARPIAKLKAPTGGHHTWTRDEVERYRACWAIGTQERLALELMLLAGLRRSDVVRLGRPHVRDGWLKFRPHKGRNRWDVTVEIPLLPALQRVIDATPSTGELTFIARRDGRPRSAKAFGMWFGKSCDAAGLPHCSAHGLRKAAATEAAESGATTHQLMAIFGWLSVKEAEVYTRAAERKRMAAAGMSHMGSGVVSVLTSAAGGKR